MKRYLYLIFLLFSQTSISEINTTNTEQDSKSISLEEDSISEFKETRYLSIEKLIIPNELKVIEEELEQSTIDVSMLTSTHSLVFNKQISEDGHTKTYKNFYSLRIEIAPLQNQDSKYLLHIFYFNWLTKKYDHKVVRSISKYNVLNELRMALYQLFKGKAYVENNKERLEKMNFERIQEINKNIEKKKIKNRQKEIDLKKQKKVEKKTENENLKKKTEKEQLIKRESQSKKAKINLSQPSLAKGVALNELSNFPSSEASSISPIKIEDSDSPQKLKSKKNNAKLEKPAQQTNETPIENSLRDEEKKNEPQQISIPRLTKFSFFAGVSGEIIKTSYIIESTTNLRYLNVGAIYSSIQNTEKGNGVAIQLKSGFPVIKQNYQLPVYREIQGDFFYKNIIRHVNLGTGLDLSPIHFVNLPALAANLQVIENDILWGKLCLKIHGDIFDKLFEVKASYYKSLTMKSNYNLSFDATKNVYSIYLQLHRTHGAIAEMSQATLSGAVTGSSNAYALSYIYDFGE